VAGSMTPIQQDRGYEYLFGKASPDAENSEGKGKEQLSLLPEMTAEILEMASAFDNLVVDSTIEKANSSDLLSRRPAR